MQWKASGGKVHPNGIDSAVQPAVSPLEQLRQMLNEAQERGLKDIRFEWAEGAETLTADERANAVIEWLNATKAWDALSTEDKMREQIKQSYESLSNVIDLCKTDLRSTLNHESISRRSKVFGGIEQAMLLLGNWIDNDTKTAIRKARKPLEEQNGA
jgi:hypothetical protein